MNQLLRWLLLLLLAAPAAAQEDRRYLNAAMQTANWLESVSIVENDTRVWPADPAQPGERSLHLYSGTCGVVLFFLEAHHATGDERYLRLAEEGARAIRQRVESHGAEENPSLYLGLAGYGFVLHETYRAGGRPEFARGALHCLEWLHERASEAGAGVEWSDTTDVVAGSAGIGLFLLYAADVIGHAPSLALAARAGDRLIELAMKVEPNGEGFKWFMTPEFPRLMPNFSHGTAGNAYFLTELYRRTAREPYRAAALKAADYLESIAGSGAEAGLLFHHEPEGEQLYYLGWCHGPPGSSRFFHRLEELQSGRGAAWQEQQVRRILDSGIPTRAQAGFWNNVGQCCGSAGVADYLMTQARLHGREGCHEKAIELTDDLLKRAEPVDDGLKWVHAEHRVRPEFVVAQTGYMQGAAGIGMWLLHLDGFLHGRPRQIVFPDNPYRAELQESPAPSADQLEVLAESIESAREQWQIPGLSVAIVHRDRVVFARGFGRCSVDAESKVDEHTLFAIGSATKAFTAAGIGILVDEERLGWDDRATDHLPEFQLFDPWVTREMRVRDLLCHRSGLSRGDLLWYADQFDRSEILHRVRHLEPSWSFRSLFGYQNIMYLAAGSIVPKFTDMDWDRFTRTRLLEPLGMHRSRTSTHALAQDDNVAAPHALIEKRIEPIPHKNIDNVAPAGSIYSSALEMTNWVRLHLNEGRHGEQQILSAETVAEMQKPQTIIRYEGRWPLIAPEADFLCYGLGWFLNDYRGEKIVQHGGNIDGMSALVGMLPERELGVVVLTNLGGNLATMPVVFQVFDLWMEAPPRDWHREYLDVYRGRLAAAEAEKNRREQERVPDTKPGLPLEAYFGRYESDLYGPITIEGSAQNMRIDFGPAFRGSLTHWHHETFLATWDQRARGELRIRFELDAEGAISGLEMEGIGRFVREP